MSSSLDIAGLRHDYVAQGLRRADLDPHPIKQFGKWFDEAAAANVRDVNAMSLATATPDGVPFVRIVLLKSVSERGFVFFTNYQSEKGQQIEENPRVALNIFWVQLERQIRISGTVEKTSREESEEYFHSRPIGSQLGAWASAQSEVIENREVLEAELAKVTERFGGGPIPLPPSGEDTALCLKRSSFGKAARIASTIVFAIAGIRLAGWWSGYLPSGPLVRDGWKTTKLR